MATITKRLNKKGEPSFRAQVRIKRDGRIVYSEVRTFPREKLAKEWAARLELSLKEPGAIEKRKLPKYKVREVLRKYLDEMAGSTQPLGRTKVYTLEMLERCDIANMPAGDLAPADILEHCRERAAAGAGPATVIQDVSYLKSAMVYATTIWKMPLQSAVRAVEEAMPVLHKQGLVGKSKPRSRRPTREEVDAILAWLRKRENTRAAFIPHVDFVEFAIYSCMRASEISSILWADLDETKRCVLVRNRKDPKHKANNDQWVPLLGPAWEIVCRQPRTEERIFPYDCRSVSRAYQQAATALQISDLRFHDLRHEGISRLFEMGYQIQEVALVSGHRSWNNLRRYTQLKPEDLHGKFDAPMAPVRVPEPVAVVNDRK